MHPHKASPDEIEALVQARHGDPFALLGPHKVKGGVMLRAFLPWAAAVEVRLHHHSFPLERLHQDGFFEVFLKDADLPLHYELIAHHRGGSTTVDDPYRYGPVLGDVDDFLFCEGTHQALYNRLGAHPIEHEGTHGVHFAVWAPNAQRVSVVGHFNAWDGRQHPMRKRLGSGLWEIFLPGLKPGSVYKYEIRDSHGTVSPLKADPVGRAAELRPSTASIVAGQPQIAWQDDAHLAHRAQANARRLPMSIYEVHLGSWRRAEDGGFLTYDQIADRLIPYAVDLGFTHLQFMPVTEHPLDLSWGYQPIGLFAATARFGDADGFARLVNRAHQAGLAVFLDWVPAHFPTDAHGLAKFDGTALYEHQDPRQGFHPDWNTAIYNFGRKEVSGFLMASALYWLDVFHIDGLRVDAVASMLYLDYSRKSGEWVPNRHGGNTNEEAVGFLRHVNGTAYVRHAGIQMIAEESTAWPGVTAPPDAGGLGFGFKWNMGWMNDTLAYLGQDPVHRRWHHDKLTFGLLYGFSENFILPISHDEVVHGKGSMLGRIPGDDWQKFATLRAYYAFMWAHPGKKLLFMGQEFGQRHEWDSEGELHWQALASPMHKGLQDCVRDLNHLYRATPALHARDCEAEGFRWIVADDRDQSVIAWMRLGAAGDSPVVMVANFTPVPRPLYRIGLPATGPWEEILNTDSSIYGGSNTGNQGGVTAVPIASHGLPASAQIFVPPLATIYLRPAVK